MAISYTSFENCSAVPLGSIRAHYKTYLTNSTFCTIFWRFNQLSGMIHNWTTPFWKVYHGIMDVTEIANITLLLCPHSPGERSAKHLGQDNRWHRKDSNKILLGCWRRELSERSLLNNKHMHTEAHGIPCHLYSLYVIISLPAHSTKNNVTSQQE
jgi:hypothetical protein